MPKKLTQEEFITKARAVHGDKYDYSKVAYINDRTKVCIVCPIHRDFWQSPSHHLRDRGCPLCAIESRKRKKYGVATNDMLYQEHTKCYSVWDGILQRCYGSKRFKYNPSYNDCTVCDEWLIYSNFKKWFDENYVEGYEIDKDIFSSDTKMYSPNNCVFIPKRLNNVIKNIECTGKGVIKYVQSYAVATRIDGKYYHKGGFKSFEDACNALAVMKYNRIFEISSKMWENGEIDSRTYIALSQKMACANTNRKGIGIELMEEYYNIAVKRVQDALSKPKTLFDNI